MMISEDFSIQHDQQLDDWQRQSSIASGLRIIAWKMIELALLDLRRKSSSYEYNSAHDWIFVWKGAKFSFELSCDIAGLDAELIRCRVREYLETGVKIPKVKASQVKARKKRSIPG